MNKEMYENIVSDVASEFRTFVLNIDDEAEIASFNSFILSVMYNDCVHEILTKTAAEHLWVEIRNNQNIMTLIMSLRSKLIFKYASTRPEIEGLCDTLAYSFASTELPLTSANYQVSNTGVQLSSVIDEHVSQQMPPHHQAKLFIMANTWLIPILMINLSRVELQELMNQRIEYLESIKRRSDAAASRQQFVDSRRA